MKQFSLMFGLHGNIFYLHSFRDLTAEAKNYEGLAIGHLSAKICMRAMENFCCQVDFKNLNCFQILSYDGWPYS